MMRRVVDATIPVGCAIATASAVWFLPASIQGTLGSIWGRAWAGALFFAGISVLVGICLRRTRPQIAFFLEFPALGVAGFFASLYGTALLLRVGWSSWVAIWFCYTIGAHYLARFVELWRARRAAERAQT